MVDTHSGFGLAGRLLIFLVVLFSVVVLPGNSRSQQELADKLGIQPPPKYPASMLEKFPTEKPKKGLYGIEELLLSSKQPYIKWADKELARKIGRNLANLPTIKQRFSYMMRQMEDAGNRVLQSGVALKSGLSSKEIVSRQLTTLKNIYLFVDLTYVAVNELKPDSKNRMQFLAAWRNHIKNYNRWLNEFFKAVGLEGPQEKEAGRKGKKDKSGEQKLVAPGAPLSPGVEPSKQHEYLVRELLDYELARKGREDAACDLTPGKGSDTCSSMLLPANRELCLEVERQQKRVCLKWADNPAPCIANIENNIKPRLAKRNKECGCDRPCHEALGKRMEGIAERLRRN